MSLIATSQNQQKPWLFIVFSTILLLSILGFVSLDEKLFLVIPPALLLAYLTVNDLRSVMYIFFLLLPFSIEMELSSSFGTDLPAEPLMLLLTGCGLLIFMLKWHNISSHRFFEPITIMLMIHLFWILITAIYSMENTISLKFFLAKIWYIVPFFFLLPYLFRDMKAYMWLIRLLGFGILSTIVVVLYRHAQLDFSFSKVHDAVRIFYRNHVNYACLIASFVPFYLVWLRYEKPFWFQRFVKLGIAISILIGLYFSFTRAAMVAAFLVIPIYFVIRYRLMKYALSVAFLFAGIFVAYLAHDNKYLDYAPDFNKTITHEKFDNLIDATTKLEDISTMERVYRWVAGATMIAEKPITGYGPGSFSHHYKKYTVSSFKTYVSDNPEKSGMHNYYLMITTEQGIPGLIIFITLVVLGLLQGEQLYHTLGIGFHRDLVLACTMILAIILAINLMNDMIETAKQGPVFWMVLGIISTYSAKWLRRS